MSLMRADLSALIRLIEGEPPGKARIPVDFVLSAGVACSKPVGCVPSGAGAHSRGVPYHVTEGMSPPLSLRRDRVGEGRR